MRNIKGFAVTLFVLAAACGLVAAGPPAGTEFTLSGSYDRPRGGSSEWDLGGSIAFPIGDHLVAGPLFRFDERDDDVDGSHFGGLIELNTGANAGLYVGAHVTYLIDTDVDGDRHSAAAVGGWKIPWGSDRDPSAGGGFVKIEASYVVDGIGDGEGFTGLIGIGGRWR